MPVALKCLPFAIIRQYSKDPGTELLWAAFGIRKNFKLPTITHKNPLLSFGYAVH